MLGWVGILIAGILNGSFAFPLKTARAWKFDQIWALHSLLAMAIWPWMVVIILVPDWTRTFSAVPLLGWLALMGWGVLFAIGSLLYGVAIDLLGIALGFAIQLGLSSVLGALLPLLWSRKISFANPHDALFLGGLAVMVVGVVLCAQAGEAKGGASGSPAKNFRKGLVVALIGGILAPTLSFGIQYGTALLKRASADNLGLFPFQVYLAWAVFLTAAGIIQAGYCLARMLRSNSLATYRRPGARLDGLQVVVMSLFWIASIFLYGRSSWMLGLRGYSVGWPVFITMIILTSNFWGVVLGEWRGAPRSARWKMLAGSFVLIGAAFLVGRGRQ